MKDLITANLDIWAAAVTAKTSGAGRSTGNKGAYGINKLRELILELAVRGKLVPQNPNDEPASELLRRTSSKQPKNEKEKTNPVEKDLKRPFELPASWEWSFLPDVSEYKVGRTPSTKSSVYWTAGDGYNWVSIADLNHNGSVLGTAKQVTQQAISEVFRCEPAPAGTILMSFKLTLGKISILGAPAFHNEAIISIYPNECIFKDYLFKVLPSRALSGNSKSAIKGNTLNAESIATLLIPLPPKAEQHRIVAKVDELMALCDQLETEQSNSADAHEKLVSILLDALTQGDNFTESWVRLQEHFDVVFTTPASIDKLKQALLQLAVMGKLVPQDSSDEPASELLKKIRKHKDKMIAEGKIKKDKSLSPIGDEEKPFELPSGWEWVRLGDIVKISGGKRVTNGYQFERVPTPYIYIRVSDMKNGTIDDSDLRYINSEMRRKIGRYIITKNDIYMTIVGATIGKCGLVPEKFDQMNLTENAARLAPWTGVDKTFVFKCLYGDACQIQFVDKTKQVGVQKMALNRLANTILPLPPYLEQHRIVAKVDELMALCDQVKAQLIGAGEQQRKLADVMIERAVA